MTDDGQQNKSKNIDSRNKSAIGNRQLEISVIRLPRISNYTDFLVFEKFRNINISYVENKDDLGEPDLIFIPGTKNTRADMAFLHESGLSEKILDAHTKGIPVFGICGGYQILGKSISDPHGIEDKPGTTKGLSLLPIETVIGKTKELAQVKGRTSAAVPFCKTGTRFEGYEIHMGKTRLSGSRSAKFAILDIEERHGKKCRASDGAVSLDELVLGTYVHGIFDSSDMHESLIKWLCGRKGIKAAHILSETRETEDDVFEKLADLIGQHVDLRIIEKSQETGVRIQNKF